MKIEALDKKSGGLSDGPIVFITLEAFQKILSFAENAMPNEITGWGIVEKEGENFLIKDVFILEQKVSGASCDENPMALNQLVAQHPDPSKIKFWWHSHADMEVFFSETDKETIRNFTGDFLISFVINRKGDYICRIDILRPFKISFKVPVLIEMEIPEEIMKFCQKEITKKVKLRPVTRIKRFFLPEELKRVG